MAKKNYIDSGVSDSDLISLAGNLQASKLAVPEKTTWDYIQEDLDEWQVAVKGRAAKFMEDLPEEFDLNKVEPEGRESIGNWYKDMRRDFMKAANKASLFDPGSFAYGEGTSKMNKIEDDLGAINGVFDNIKAVRTQAIKDKDNYASGVPESQKSMMDAIVSGEMFQGMVIKDGGIQFKVEGATYPDGQDYFTEEDIKNLRTKGSLSEEGINAINANAEEDMTNGIAFKDGTYRSTIVKALNKGKKTGENQDLMLDVGGVNEDGTLNPEPYVTKWLTENPNDENFPDLKSIKENLSEFYNQNEDNFIDNFLMANARNVHGNTKMSEKARVELEKKKADLENVQATIANTKSITAERYRKNKEDGEETVGIEKQSASANKILSDGGSTFNHGKYSVTESEDGSTYQVTWKDGSATRVQNFPISMKGETNMRGLIGLERDEKGEDELARYKSDKNQNVARTGYILKALVGDGDVYLTQEGKDSKTGPKYGATYSKAFRKGPTETIKFFKNHFKGDMIKAVQIDGDNIKVTVDGKSKVFMTAPAFWSGDKEKALMQWISDNLNQ